MEKDQLFKVFKNAAYLDGDKNNYLAFEVKDRVKILNLDTGRILKGNRNRSYNLSRNFGGYENISEEKLKETILTSGGITSAGKIVDVMIRHDNEIADIKHFIALHTPIDENPVNVTRINITESPRQKEMSLVHMKQVGN